jgi:hypothetical protein
MDLRELVLRKFLPFGSESPRVDETQPERVVSFQFSVKIRNKVTTQNE